MGKGTNTTTTASSTSPNPQAAALYQQILQQAQGVAGTPYQAYTGDLTAPVNSQQQAGIAGINANAGFASPYIEQAQGIAGGAANPLTSGQIQNYLNPYTQNVIDTTNAQMMHDQGTQMAQLQGNQISQGALGGNATGVAKGILAGQNARTMASTDANLYNQGYQGALTTAAQQYQQNPLVAANSIANFGVAGQNAALTGANAQLGAGTLQQQTEQARLNALYGQYAQAQAYPFQTTQWLAGIGSGVAPGLGATSTGSSTAPAPNQTAQYLGAGVAAAGLFAARGGAIHRADGGQVMSDADPVGVAGGQHYAQHAGSPYQIRPNQDGSHSVINVQTGQVHFTGTPSGALNAQASLNYRNPGYAGGGGVAGVPWANAPTWVPTIGISNAAPHAASAPGVASTASPNIDWTKLANVGGDGPGLLSSNPVYGGDSRIAGVMNGSYGGSSSDPLPGLDPSDYGPGYAGGGGVSGYAVGGMPSPMPVLDWNQPVGSLGEDGPPLPPGASFEDRSAPVREAVTSGDFDPRGANYTPFEGTPGMVASNNGVVPLPAGRPAGAGAPVVADDDDEEEAPTGVAGRTGGAPAGSGPPVMAFDGKTPYASAPDAVTHPRGGGLGGLGFGLISPNAKTGLLAAGLGMLSSRSPFLGNAVGEGGIAGLSAYGAAQAHDEKVASDSAKLAKEAQQHAEEMTLKYGTLGESIRHNKAVESKEFKPTYGVVKEEVDPDTGITHKVYGWIDPNTKKAVPESSVPAGSPAPAPKVDANGLPLTGQAYLDTLSPNRATLAKQIADYRVNPAGLSVRGGHREQAIADATRYNPDYDQRIYTGSNRAMSNFYGGPEGRTVRSLNVAIDHLNTLNEAGAALQNGDYPKLNQIVNYYKQQTGQAVTTNFDSIKQVVSAEIAKAVVGGQTALHDRDDMAQRANNASSPQQLTGLIDEFKKLMAGQMNGLRKQYEFTTRAKNFDDMLEPGTKKELARFKDVKPNWNSEGGTSGFTPPQGAIPRVYQGKTYYYDPNTKQPYPGQ